MCYARILRVFFVYKLDKDTYKSSTEKNTI